jgi:hypothetical protein
VALRRRQGREPAGSGGGIARSSSVCMLSNPANPSMALALRSVQAAAQKVGMKVPALEAGTPEGIEKAFSAMVQQKAGAVIVPLDMLYGQ